MDQSDYTPDQKIEFIITAFEKYALGDIRKNMHNGMPIAAFILAFCFIDQVGTYIYDLAVKGQKDGTSRQKKFIREYLNKVSAVAYQEADLIDLLRNSLVHNYSVTDKQKPSHPKYVLEYETPALHLQQVNGAIVINVTGFVSDLEKAFQLYSTALLADTGLQKIACANFDRHPVLKAAKL